MHKKDKVNGHVVHRLPKCPGLYYTVEPEHSCIAVYILSFDPATGEPCYDEFEDITICTPMLGKHGYLEGQVERIARRHSDYTIREILSRIADEHEKLANGDLIALNDIFLKGEKKMGDKKYYSGSVAVTTWRTRWTVKDLNDVTSNHRTDIITFKDGKYFGILPDPKNKIMAKMPIDRSAGNKRYTKEEIAEAITATWDKGEYAEDQTDISWTFNPDPEGFTGTVDLATVLLKDPKGTGGGLDAYHNPQVCARCRVRIVDGTFFEKLDGSSKLADILKNHKGAFTTKKDVEKWIKDRWNFGDFGNDASYFILDIKEE